jgi:hypothetical protein
MKQDYQSMISISKAQSSDVEVVHGLPSRRAAGERRLALGEEMGRVIFVWEGLDVLGFGVWA